jgi:Uma2 family endonuclease
VNSPGDCITAQWSNDPAESGVLGSSVAPDGSAKGEVASFDLPAADVAAVTRERYAAIDLEDNLHGALDLVIEVKSPSNTPRKLQELASLSLANGAIEFWIVGHVLKSITVVQRDGSRETYGVGAEISLAAFGAILAVAGPHNRSDLN